MALLRIGDWIDGRTGEHVPAGLEEDTANDPSPPTEHRCTREATSRRPPRPAGSRGCAKA